MKTKYEQIIDVANIATKERTRDLASIITLAENESLPSASSDAKKVLLLVIDMQNDFMEDIGSLGVTGSKGDVERLTRWIYANMDKITQVMCSLDTHSVFQIFHPSWWADEQGNPPKPYTEITYDDVVNGRWRPMFSVPKSINYVKNLENLGKKRLMIWPYHCLEGSDGASLENEFTNMLYFHATARKSKPITIQKGRDATTEMYGIIKAEYDPNNFVNEPVLKVIEDFDEIYIAGEASSHCVMESGKQILEYYKDRPDITQRITILEDCTSPVANCEQIAEDAFAAFKAQYGIRVAKSTDIIL